MVRMNWMIGGAALLLIGSAPASKWQPHETLVATGRIAALGLNGTWRSVNDLGNGRFVTRTDLTAFKTADIYDGRTHWRIEPSGGSHKLDSPFALRRTQTSAWLARFGWLQAGFGGAQRAAAVTRTDAGKRYSVLTATPRGGEPVDLWFDAVTGELARAVEQECSSRSRRATPIIAPSRGGDCPSRSCGPTAITKSASPSTPIACSPGRRRTAMRRRVSLTITRYPPQARRSPRPPSRSSKSRRASTAGRCTSCSIPAGTASCRPIRRARSGSRPSAGCAAAAAARGRSRSNSPV